MSDQVLQIGNNSEPSIIEEWFAMNQDVVLVCKIDDATTVCTDIVNVGFTERQVHAFFEERIDFPDLVSFEGPDNVKIAGTLSDELLQFGGSYDYGWYAQIPRFGRNYFMIPGLDSPHGKEFEIRCNLITEAHTSVVLIGDLGDERPLIRSEVMNVREYVRPFEHCLNQSDLMAIPQALEWNRELKMLPENIVSLSVHLNQVAKCCYFVHQNDSVEPVFDAQYIFQFTQQHLKDGLSAPGYMRAHSRVALVCHFTEPHAQYVVRTHIAIVGDECWREED